MAALQRSALAFGASPRSLVVLPTHRAPGRALPRAHLVASARRGCASARIAQKRALCVARAGGAVTPAPAAPVVSDTQVRSLLRPGGDKSLVLVDFWAPWCGPCRMIAPIIDEIARDFQDTVATVKLNTDQYPGIASEFKVRSIPTAILFKNGSVVETVVGAVPKDSLVQRIRKHL